MPPTLIKESILAVGLYCGLCLGADVQPATPTLLTDAPTRQEDRAAIERGLAFLQKAQNSKGWCSMPDQPADPVLVTCYAVMTLKMLDWKMP